MHHGQWSHGTPLPVDRQTDRQTDTHTHTHTHDRKYCLPATSLVGGKKETFADNSGESKDFSQG